MHHLILNWFVSPENIERIRITQHNVKCQHNDTKSLLVIDVPWLICGC